MPAFDFNQLPPPRVIEQIDFETLFAERKARLIELYPEPDRAAIAATLELESEPVVKMIQENAYREMLLRQRINESAMAVLLAYSTGPDLDVLLGNFYMKRLEVAPADNSTNPPKPAVMESDNDFRARGQLRFESLSVAGPRAAYEYHARSADGQVRDASATSPSPAEVVITVLSREGEGEASAQLLDKVYKAVTPETVRPVADRVTVSSANITSVTIQAILHLETGPEAELVLAAAEQSLSEYQEKQTQLGGSVYCSAIDAALHVEGVRQVVIISPSTDIELDETQAPYFAEPELSVAGV